MVVTRIGVLSLGKVMGIVYAALGLICGAVLALLSAVGVSFVASGAHGPEAWLGVLFGVAAVIVLPILNGLMAFLAGLLIAGVYNLAARLAGGLEVEVRDAV